uniref:Uncharacterized protein n=1 Tax=Ditylenchus dipsaci TaxID=166011 RepID=A0A915DMD1_9BILA
MQSTPKRRGEQNTYYQVAVFNGDDATAQLWKENTNSIWNKDKNKWNLKKKSLSEKHDVENYVCSYSRRKNYTCLAVLRIRRIGGKQEIIVERAESHSDHKPRKTTSYCNWYEGASDNVSTNNSLESRNRVIKACEVVGKNLPLQKFMGQMKLMVENCSLSPDHQSPAKVPSIAPDVYRQAYQLKKEKRSMVSFGSAYLLPSKSGLHKNLVETFAALHSLPSYTNWELYKENRSAIHILNHSSGWPNFYCCTCSVGIKKSPFKHSVMLMKIKGILSYPRDATAEPLYDDFTIEFIEKECYYRAIIENTLLFLFTGITRVTNSNKNFITMDITAPIPKATKAKQTIRMLFHKDEYSARSSEIKVLGVNWNIYVTTWDGFTITIERSNLLESAVIAFHGQDNGWKCYPFKKNKEFIACLKSQSFFNAYGNMTIEFDMSVSEQAEDLCAKNYNLFWKIRLLLQISQS